MLPRNLESLSPLCVILVNIKGNQMLLAACGHFSIHRKILKIEDAIIEKNLKDILPS